MNELGKITVSAFGWVFIIIFLFLIWNAQELAKASPEIWFFFVFVSGLGSTFACGWLWWRHMEHEQRLEYMQETASERNYRRLRRLRNQDTEA